MSADLRIKGDKPTNLYVMDDALVLLKHVKIRQDEISRIPFESLTGIVVTRQWPWGNVNYRGCDLRFFPPSDHPAWRAGNHTIRAGDHSAGVRCVHVLFQNHDDGDSHVHRCSCADIKFPPEARKESHRQNVNRDPCRPGARSGGAVAHTPEFVGGTGRFANAP